MPNQTEQSTFASNTCRTISGQLAEWGIDFNQNRVSQLSTEQQHQLQTWINAGVEADEVYQVEFASLPEFMENELLEMSGKLSTEPRKAIIEQAINSYEAEIPITGNPYLFDTNPWHLWRKAYCCWHHGETLDAAVENSPNSYQNETSNDVSEINQQLAFLYPQLYQTKNSLKQLRRKLKKKKQQRKSLIHQQTQLIHQLCKSFDSATNISLVSSQYVDTQGTKIESKSEDIPSNTIQEAQPAPLASSGIQQTKIIRIPVTGPETNRIEVYLQQNNSGRWQAGHLWSIEADTRTGHLSRGSKHPDQQQITYHTETEALLNEVIYLSQGIIGVIEIESQIIDYLNLLEEYPGQLEICNVCHCHFINNKGNHAENCAQCCNLPSD